MHHILPSRDLIANDVEMMVQAHRLDAVVLLCSCDKIVPGMLMAAARIDVPAIVVVGGPMEGGCTFDDRAADTTSLTEGLGMLAAGTIDEQTYLDLEDCATPTCGHARSWVLLTPCAVSRKLSGCVCQEAPQSPQLTQPDCGPRKLPGGRWSSLSGWASRPATSSHLTASRMLSA